jgi:hypothetical protein
LTRKNWVRLLDDPDCSLLSRIHKLYRRVRISIRPFGHAPFGPVKNGTSVLQQEDNYEGHEHEGHKTMTKFSFVFFRVLGG